MLSKYKKAISEIKADDSLNEKILLGIKQSKNSNKKEGVINTIKKVLISIGTLASLAACGGLVYAGIKSNKPTLENYGISFSDKYDEYEYKFENQSVEANGTIIKLESAVCNEGYTVLKFDVTLSDEIKEYADETVGLIYLSYNDILDESNCPRLSGSNYNLIINDKEQWLRGKYGNDIRENIFNKNYTVYELYFIPDSFLDEKNTFTISLENFYLNVGEKIYSIPGKMKFELSKEEAVKASTEILGNNDYIKYRTLEQKVEKVIETPLQNLIKLQESVSDITFDLTNKNYPGDNIYTIYDQDGNELISTYLDTDLKYFHKDGSIEEGSTDDFKDDYSDVEKMITEKYLVTEKNDNIKNLLIKVYSKNEYYGTKVQIGEYKVDLVNKTISTSNSKEYVYREIASAIGQEHINDTNRNADFELDKSISIIDGNIEKTYDSTTYDYITEFTINLNTDNIDIYRNNYSIGDNKKANAVGYYFYVNSDDKFFNIIVMDKNEDYVFEDLSGNEIQKIKITENDTKAVYVLKEKKNYYNDYKDILNSIKLK